MSHSSDSAQNTLSIPVRELTSLSICIILLVRKGTIEGSRLQ